MIGIIAWRDLKTLFGQPLAWVVLAVIQGLVAWFFFAGVGQYETLKPRLSRMPDAPGVTDIVVMPTFDSAAIVLLMVVPILSMRLIAEERRAETIRLLFSAPVSMTQIVLGKFLGMLGFLLAVLVLSAIMPLSLLPGTQLDLGRLAAGLIGLFLLLAAFGSIGLFFSTLTRSPIVAGVATFGLLLFLWIVNFGSVDLGPLSPVLDYIAMLGHYSPFLDGTLASQHVVYFLLVTLAFLVLSVQRLDAQRLQT